MIPFNLKEYLKNPSREVVTSDGKNARIICTDAKDIYPIIALIIENDGGESLETYTIDGKNYIHEESPYDLFFSSEKKVGWVNVFRGKDGPITGDIIFSSKEEAEESSMHCCGFTKSLYLTTVKIEWEE